MLIEFRGKYDTPEDRKRLATSIAHIINAESYEPIMINSDDHDWKVHRGNDWWLHFNNENTSLVTINYRYDNPKSRKEAALGSWLAVRFYCEVKEVKS